LIASSLLACWTILLLASCWPASTLANTQEKVIAFVNGTLVDGTGANPVIDAVLLIQGEHIMAAGERTQVNIPNGAQVIDIKGKTLLPGFINAHVHHGFNEENLKAWLVGGVTTVRDESIIESGSLKDLMAFRDRVNKDPQYARLVSAGRMITVPGGYGSLFVTSPEDARKQVFDELDSGVDMIKLSIEDGYAGATGLPKLSHQELASVINAAHERGVHVSGHITQASYLKIIVEAGVDDVAHLAYDPISTNTIKLMVEKGIYLVPTFTVFRNYNAPMGTCTQNLAKFNKAGGKVALGNDYGGGPGKFELGIPMYEIEMMAQVGMTPMQIIIASTRNAAHVVGLEKVTGTLEVGKIADVLIVDGNPLQDLQALANVHLVVHDGQMIFPSRDQNSQD